MNWKGHLAGDRNSKRWVWGFVASSLIVGLFAYAYYTGDQAQSVALSPIFSVDTTDPTSLTNPSTSLLASSGVFTVDTTDPLAESNPLASLLAASALFTIDTTDPLSDSNPLSGTLSISSLFTIDTTAADSTFTMSGLFTIDTSDSGPNNSTFAVSGFFTIDTQDPPPQDDDNDGLHDLWEQIYFSSLFAYGPDEDPDHDGLSNFFEFAFGLDPRFPSASPISTPVITSEGGLPYLYFTYTRHVLAINMVNYDIQTSVDLNAWTSSGASAEEVDPVQNLTGSIELVTVRIRLSSPLPAKLFVRIQITPK